MRGAVLTAAFAVVVPPLFDCDGAWADFREALNAGIAAGTAGALSSGCAIARQACATGVAGSQRIVSQPVLPGVNVLCKY